jgi:hypothetical protein
MALRLSELIGELGSLSNKSNGRLMRASVKRGPKVIQPLLSSLRIAELSGLDTEPAEIIYFKFYKSQIPVIEQAIETCWELTRQEDIACADFLAGANLDSCNSNVLLHSILRLFTFLPSEEQKAFLDHATEKAS